MLIFDGKVLATKTIEPSEAFARSTRLVTLLDDDGEMLRLVAAEEAFARLAELEQMTPVRVSVRYRRAQSERGQAFKLLVDGVLEAGAAA